MVSTAFRTYVAGVGLLASTVVSFNGFVWQLNRRSWKQSVIESHSNMKRPPLKNVPPIGAKVDEYQPIEVTGTLDNEGSIVVGPRPMPLKRDGVQSEENARAGFLILTPFEEDGTGYVVMVNRGWVPIDASKSRLQRVQYTGDGLKHCTIRGVIRREESINSWYYGENTDANKGPAVGTAWLASRPFEAARDYFKRRYGEASLERIVDEKGARHWMIEIVEDHTGEDQRLVKGTIFPVRRRTEDLMHTSITPMVHSFYAAFWLSVAVMSMGCMRLIMVGRAADVKAQAQRFASQQVNTELHRAEQAAFNAQVQAFSKSGGDVSKLVLKPKVTLPTPAPAAPTTATATTATPPPS